MRRSNVLLVLGFVILVAGAAVLVYGIIAYSDLRGAPLNVFTKALTGQSPAENQAIIEMIAGGAAALIGLVLLVVPRRRRR